MKARWIIALLIAAWTLTVRSLLPAATIDGLAATVNGEVITLLELEKAGKPLVEKKLQTSLKRERSKVKREVLSTVLENLIVRKLQIQRARELGIRVSDQEVDAAIVNIMSSSSLSEDMLQRALDEEGLSREQYQQQIKDQITFSKLMQREIRARLTITPEELENYYQEHREDYFRPERIKVRHLLVKVEGTIDTESVQRARRKALDIIEEFENGADFDELVRRNMPGTAAGEEIVSDWLKRGEFLKELEVVAFSLSVGKVSEPVRSKAGFHLIQVVDKEEAGYLSLETTADSIREKLTRVKMERDFKEWLLELRESSQVEILY